MRLFKSRKSTDSYSTSTAQENSSRSALNHRHSTYHSKTSSNNSSNISSNSPSTCAIKFNKSLSNSSTISSSLPDLNDDSPVMILSCTPLSVNGTTSNTAATNVMAGSTASAAQVQNSGSNTNRTISHTNFINERHLGVQTYSNNSSGRQTPSGLSVASLNDATIQRHPLPAQFKSNNSLMLNYGGSSSNISHTQQQTQYSMQKFANPLSVNGTSSASSSCLYDKNSIHQNSSFAGSSSISVMSSNGK